MFIDDFKNFSVGSDEVANKSLRAIKRDFRALEQLVKGSRAQVVLSSSSCKKQEEPADHYLAPSLVALGKCWGF